MASEDKGCQDPGIETSSAARGSYTLHTPFAIKSQAWSPLGELQPGQYDPSPGIERRKSLSSAKVHERFEIGAMAQCGSRAEELSIEVRRSPNRGLTTAISGISGQERDSDLIGALPPKLFASCKLEDYGIATRLSLSFADLHPPPPPPPPSPLSFILCSFPRYQITRPSWKPMDRGSTRVWMEEPWKAFNVWIAASRVSLALHPRPIHARARPCIRTSLIWTPIQMLLCSIGIPGTRSTLEVW